MIHTTVESAHLSAMARGAKCTECPLYGLREGPVQSEVRQSRLVVIGEAPGKNEIEQGRPFVGMSGQQLIEGLSSEGWGRKDVSILNVCECRPPEGLAMEVFLHRNKDKKSPIDCCLPRLKHDIQASGARHTLALGKRALEAVGTLEGIPVGGKKKYAGEKRIAAVSFQRGHPFDLGAGRWLMASIHPAAALRTDRSMLHVIREDIAMAVRIAKRGGPDLNEPDYVLAPSVDQVEWACQQFIEAGVTVVCDIETDSGRGHSDRRGFAFWNCNIRCIGLGNKQTGIFICVPWRWMNGQDYWTDQAEAQRVFRAVRGVMENCPLGGHNFAFDVGVLEREGFISKEASERLYKDSMIAHHNTDECDCDHDLGFVASRCLEFPLHKNDVDHKVVGNEARDQDLWLYNMKDVFVTEAAIEWTEDRVARLGTSAQNAIDLKKAQIARRMSWLGLCIHEPTRLEMSKALGADIEKFEGQIRSICGRDVNPQSPQQVAAWLYDEKGHMPRLNSRGKEWTEDDTRGTSADALLALWDSGVDEDTEKFIDAILAHRARTTLKTRYTDNLDSYLEPAWGDEYRRYHASFGVHQVPSGRMNTKPNVQNWPKSAAINMRSMLWAPPGHVIVEADYAQLEVRGYAVASGDRYMLKALREGMDLHNLNAATLFAPDGSEASIMATYEKFEVMRKAAKEEGCDPAVKNQYAFIRLVAKIFCFLEEYGGTADKLFHTMRGMRNKATGDRLFKNLKPEFINECHQRFHNAHPECHVWQRNVLAGLRDYGYVADRILGRKRYFPGGPTKRNAPINHTIQALASSVADRGLLRLVDRIPFGSWSPWTGVFLQVHDQIAAYVPEARAEEAVAIFEEALYYEMEGVPFPAEPSIVTNLGKA